MKKSMIVTLLASVFLTFFIFNSQTSAAAVLEGVDSNYIIKDMNGTSQRQKINIYNQSRLEMEILPDNSMIQYTYDANGNLLKRSKATPAEPYIFSTSVVSYDIYLKGVPDSVKTVRFPTWTDYNQQDDLEWIDGVKVAPNLWRGTVVLSKHGMETGAYVTHVYADNKAVAGVTTQIKNTQTVRAPQTVGLDAEYYEVVIEGVSRTIQEVKFPTWTEKNDQDDIERPYVIGERIGNTTWKIRIPFSKHNYEAGNYFTHIYAHDKYGNSNYIGGTSVAVKGGVGVSGPKTANISAGSYDVLIYGLDPNIKRVQFPTWTSNKEQDDLEWIEGVKVAPGVWKATVFFQRHNSEVGSYITHIYADNKYVGALVCNVNR
ncbi:GBS Bsp-like repeat-containing protein [Paenibacillus sp. FSL H7-0357]|uniref:GBS Bsp-like repeat-containing protein n=1 Tax=Paenibacillus sp. FSL H7-0357 TaxID=1536774 RepID=UPI00068A18AC|nr:GBS Bsp-like repeat-containing protein [Paenibacillus sp. FSL H7-0357]